MYLTLRDKRLRLYEEFRDMDVRYVRTLVSLSRRYLTADLLSLFYEKIICHSGHKIPYSGRCRLPADVISLQVAQKVDR